MSKTVAQCREYFLRYIDEATKKGVALPTTKNADYRDKFNYFLDLAQKYIAGIIKISAVYQITQTVFENLVDDGFTMVQHLDEDVVYTATGAKSYYFEMDGIGTATIAINGVTFKAENNITKRQFTAFKGNTGANSTDVVTIIFSGTYPYNIRNVALYEYAFPIDSDVPDFTPYVSYDMPTDFMAFDDVLIRTDPEIYEPYVQYKWEKNKKIILGRDQEGSFDIHYFKYPATIAYNESDSTILDIEEKAAELVVLQAGIMATAADNPSLSSWLRSLYLEKVQNVLQPEDIGEKRIQTIFSMI